MASCTRLPFTGLQDTMFHAKCPSIDCWNELFVFPFYKLFQQHFNLLGAPHMKFTVDDDAVKAS